VPKGLTSTARPLPEDIAAMVRARSPHISPDGTQIAYTVGTATRDPEAKPSDSDTTGGWSRASHLFVIGTKTGSTPRQLTFGERGGAPAQWAPDGRHLAFIRKGDDGERQIHVLALDGGEARAVDTGAHTPHGFKWTDDGQGFYFLATLEPDEDAKATTWTGGGASQFEKDYANDAVFEVRRGAAEPKQLTDGKRHVIDYAVSPNGRSIAVVTSASADPYLQSMQATIQLMPLSGGAAREVTEKPGMVAQIGWSPNSARLAWSNSPRGLSLLHGLQVYAVASSKRTDVAKSHDVTIGAFAWMPDSKHIAAVLQDKTFSRLARFGIDGGLVRAKAPSPYVLWQLDGVTANGHAAAVASNPQQPPEIAVVDLRRFGSRILTDTNPQVKAHWALAKTEVVQWTNPDGQTVEGILFKSQSSTVSPPPLLVMPHGGPDSVSQTYFDVWAHHLAARGYSVLRPNYRGGTGYGFEWYAANRGKLGDIEFADIESGVDHLIKVGLAHKDRLFYGGWSWGGYLSAWTLGHTTRYRAIVVGAGVNDTAIQYVTSDINHGAAADWEYKARPYTDKALWDAQNPARHMANAKTPTLIIHGRGDTRVDFVNGQVLYRALMDVGCPVEFWAYPRENHGFREPAHVAHMLTQWALWLDSH
jgi:dipeptidyl aminopeptidase/acylaminoacyl peptidase